jgi:hypothetical protein
MRYGGRLRHSTTLATASGGDDVTPQRRVEKKACGECYNCTKPAVAGYVHCESCRAVNSVASAKRRARLRTAKACRVCGGEPLKGKSLCHFCREKDIAHKRGYRQAKVARGECVNCPAKAKPGMTYCAKHLAHSRKRQLVSRVRKANYARRKGQLLAIYDDNPRECIRRLARIVFGRPHLEERRGVGA